MPANLENSTVATGLEKVSVHSHPKERQCQFSSVQLLSHVRLSVTPWTAACQGSLSITNSQSLLKLMFIESMMPSNHLMLCCPLSHLQSFPASGSFQMSHFFISGDQNTGVGSCFLLQRIFPTQRSEPRSPALQVDSLPAEPPGKPMNIGVSSRSLLQRIFLTQESNRGLLHCRRILYQLNWADLLEKIVMLARIEGRRRRGWQRMRWLDGISDSMDMSLSKLGDSEGQGSLMCRSPWGHKESDTA